MNAHVAIFTVPIPALINPTFSLVATLIRRGYRVSYVTSERYAAEISALGAEVVRCPRLESPFDQDDDEAMPIEYQYVKGTRDLAPRVFSLSIPFYKKHRPELVIYDSMAFAGRLIADRLEVPALRMSNQTSYDRETIDSGIVPLDWKEKELELERHGNQFFASHGSSRVNMIRENKEHTFYLYLEELQLGKSFDDQEFFYAPRCIAERPNVPRWTPMRGNRPVALMSSSTTYSQNIEFTKNCLAALARSGWDTVLAVGSNNLAAFSPLPVNCHPFLNLPSAAVMPHVDLLISGAGLATAMEAAYHGCPILMLTGGHSELEMYARRFQECGVGVHLGKVDATPDRVAQWANRMIDDSETKTKIRRVQNAVRTGAGAEELVNWIENRSGLIQRRELHRRRPLFHGPVRPDHIGPTPAHQSATS